MNGICSIISGGEYSPMHAIEESAYIIACDRGYDYARQESIIPNLIIGDMDSCSETLPQGIKTIRLPVEKDDTDTMYAIRHALSMGFKRIRLYCALGGRIDHLYANIQSSAFAVENGTSVEIISRDCEIYVLGNSSICLPKREGWSLSVFSVSDKSYGVTEAGVKYPLNNVVLENRIPLGVSNEWNGDAKISVEQGILAIMLCRIL